MARPVLERLQVVGMIGVWGVAIVALVQLVAISTLMFMPAAASLGARAPLRLVVAIGAILIVLILVAVYFFVIVPNAREWRKLIERAEERRRRFAAIFSEHPDAIAVYKADGTIQRGNPAAIALLGFSPEMVGKHWTVHVAVAERDEMDRQFQFACSGHVAKFESTFLSASGEDVPVMCYLVPTVANGTVVSLVGTARDLREIKYAQERERLQVARISALANIKSEFASHPEKQIQQMIEVAAKTLTMEGGAVAFITGNEVEVAYSSHADMRPGFRIELASTFARHAHGSREVLAIADTTMDQWKTDPAVLAQPWKSYIGTTIFVESQPVGVLSFTRHAPRAELFGAADIDFMRVAAALIGAALERVRNETLLAREAHHDRVTGLANRAYFEEQMRKSVARAKRQGGHVRVHFIDLDEFKAVNDSIGHAAGDDVLRVMAARLRSLVREEDIVARLGGDEFVILESSHVDEGDSTALGNRIVAAASELMYIGDRIVRIGASVGVATYPRHAQSEEDLLKCADSAMYLAKTAGKGAVRLYSYG